MDTYREVCEGYTYRKKEKTVEVKYKLLYT